jgi:pimeloyl-ACP methyl ester carboxylesterase
VSSFEKWREEMKLDKMYLCAHSMGAIFASSYAIQNPDKVHVSLQTLLSSYIPHYDKSDGMIASGISISGRCRSSTSTFSTKTKIVAS